MENGLDSNGKAVVPAEIDRWNWGAFALNWIWGLGNRTYLSLLTFVPVLGLFMPFVLGAKGSAWAWQNGQWESVEQFKRVQRRWAIGALFAYASVAVFVVGLFFAIGFGLERTDVYRLAYARLEGNAQADAALGRPYRTGWVRGSVDLGGTRRHGQLSFPVKGAHASGTLFVDAVMDMGRWNVNQLELEVDGQSERIDLRETETTASAARQVPPDAGRDPRVPAPELSAQRHERTAAATTWRIADGTPAVHGALSKKQVESTLQRHANELVYCAYSAAVPPAPNGIQLSLKLVIAPTGAVQHAVMEQSSDAHDGQLDACLVRATQRLTFPAPRGGGIVVVSYPFALRSDES